MSNPDNLREHHDPAAIFSALGDEIRLALVSKLSDGRPRSIMHLTKGLGLSRQGVTKHLRVLENAGLVKSRKLGRESRFVLAPDPVRTARNYLERVAADWDEALRNLKAFVEEEQ
jgi:DNA-binding transcriptional ArsR family regulator